MDCAEFETRLTELLSGEWDDDGRRGNLLDRLRLHAEQCGGCRGALDLLELAAEPVERRDWNEPPAESYGEKFERRVRARVDRSSAPVPGRGRLGRWALVAAALALAAVGWVLVRPKSTEPVRVATEQTRAPEVMPDWDDLEPGMIDEAATFGVWGEPAGDEGWIYPTLEELEPEATEGMLEWLRQQNDELRGVKS